MPGAVFPRLTPPPHALGAPPARRHTFVGCKAHPVPSLPSPPAAAPALKALVPMAFKRWLRAGAAAAPGEAVLWPGAALPVPRHRGAPWRRMPSSPVPASLCMYALCIFCVCYLFNPSILHTICSAAINSTRPAPLYWEHT